MTSKKPAAHADQSQDDELDGTRRHKISISIDRDLLRRVDAYCKKHGLNRSALFSIGVSLFMEDQIPRRRE